MSKSRNWCFTLNNPEEGEFIMPSNLKLLIANREIGNSGTPHFQGYVEFNTSVALSHLRNWNGRGHYEIRKGDQSQAIRYCLKDFLNDDGTPALAFDVSLEALAAFGLVCSGLDTSQALSTFLDNLGKKEPTKLQQLKTLIDQGYTEKEIADYDFDTWCRSHRALQAYRLLCVTPRTWPMEVIVLYGPPGTGKSKYCMDNYPTAYWKQSGKWWDNYGREETVVLDDFYAWLRWDVLLRLCDRYPLLVETKGGQCQFASKRIVITSNQEPQLWYKSVPNYDAFVRRVSTWIYMGAGNSTMIFTEYRDFQRALNTSVYIAQV